MTTDPVRRIGQLVETIHSVVYFAPEPQAAFEDLGLRGFWRGYFASRLAAIGAVDARRATLLLGGFAPSMVERAVPDVWQLAAPPVVLAARQAAASAALTRLLGDVDPEPAERLTRRAVSRMTLSDMPMAAAQRAAPRPEDHIGGLWHDCTVLREHRGDAHLQAVAAAGLRWPEPHVLGVSLGHVEGRVQEFRGWSDEEWRAAEASLRAREDFDPQRLREEVEAATDELVTPAYDGVDLEALDRALTPIAQAASAQLRYPNPIGVPPV